MGERGRPEGKANKHYYQGMGGRSDRQSNRFAQLLEMISAGPLQAVQHFRSTTPAVNDEPKFSKLYI